MMLATTNKEQLMSTRPTKPRLIKHHAYRSWTSTWRDDSGAKRTARFGREGEVSRTQASARFKNWLSNEWEGKEHVRNPSGAAAVYTVDVLCGAYTKLATESFVKHGRQTTHVGIIQAALQQFSDHIHRDRLTGRERRIGSLPAAEIGAPHVASFRDVMIFSRLDTEAPLALKTVNSRLYCVKAAFGWAREQGHVPRECALDVAAVAPLRKGRSEALDPEEVRPIAWDIVEQTIQYAGDVLGAMIQLQWLTGMRPSEVCLMRGGDIEANGEVWIYTPAEHKTEHLGKARQIALGPKSIDIVKKFLQVDTEAYLFSPADAERRRRELLSKARKTPLHYGNAPGTNRSQRPRWTPGSRYTAQSYRKAITYACERAFAMPAGLRDARRPDPLETPEQLSERQAARRAWHAEHAWTPNQLRHSWATRIRKDFGIEDASVGLGHSNLQTTLIYAERDLKKAIEIARKVG